MENETKIQETVPSRALSKKVVAVVLAGAICMGGYYYMTTSTPSSFATTPANNLYREQTVTTGAIIVGLNESGSASMNTSSLSYSFQTEILESYVKPGQYVEEGDVLFTIDTETLQDEYESTKINLEQARLSLTQTLLNGESKKLDADLNYQTKDYNGTNAQDVYELTILQIENEVTTLTDTIYELRAERKDIQAQLDNGLTNDYGIASIKTKLAAIAGELITYQDYTEHSKSCSGCEEWNHASLDDKISALKSEQSKLEEDLVKASDSYDAQYEKYEDRLDEIYTQLEKALTNRDNYVATLELKKLDAQATYDKTVYNYENNGTSYQITLSQIEADNLTAQQKVASLEKELAELSKVQTSGAITAPCSGYIMSIADTGVTQKENATLITIADKDTVNIRVSISQDDIATVKVGMETSVVFDAYKDITLPGVVDSISITPSGGMSSSVNYVVTIACDLEEEMVVYEGMTASISFIQKQKQNVLTVSNKCITNENGKQYVKVKRGDTIEKIEIETGFSDGFDVEIISGLSEGDIVVIESVVNRNAT